MEVEIATVDALNAWDVKEYNPVTMSNIIWLTWEFKCKRYPNGLIKDGIDPRDLLSLSRVQLESQVLLYSFGVIPALVEIRNSDGKVYYPCHI